MELQPVLRGPQSQLSALRAALAAACLETVLGPGEPPESVLLARPEDLPAIHELLRLHADARLIRRLSLIPFAGAAGLIPGYLYLRAVRQRRPKPPGHGRTVAALWLSGLQLAVLILLGLLARG